MTQQLIGIGTTANDGTGDSLRLGADKINDNFTELYALQSATINAAGFPGATDVEKIQGAINQAVGVAAERVFVPATMLPYTSASVTFSSAVRMVREGGDWSVYDVRAYGAAGIGTNDTAAFQAAVDGASASGGGTVHVPNGTYGLWRVNLAANVQLRGTGWNTVLHQLVDDDVLSGIGSADAAKNLTANVAAGDLTVTVSAGDGASFVADDYALLHSEEAVPNSTAAQKFGELVRVVSSVAGAITLDRRTQRAYTTANTAGLRKLTLMSGIGIQNLRIVNPTPGTLDSSFILLRYVLDPRITAVWGLDADNPLLILDTVEGGVVDSLWGRDLADDPGHVPPRVGYVASVGGACTGTRLNNLYGEVCRHVFTTNGSSVGYGIPYGIVVSNSVGVGTTHHAFDTHQEGDGITFVNCLAIGALEGGGFQARAPRTRYVGCGARYCVGSGFDILVDAVGSQLQACQAMGAIRVLGAGGRGVQVDAAQCSLVGVDTWANAAQGMILSGDDVAVTGGRHSGNNLAAATLDAVFVNNDVDGVSFTGVVFENDTNAIRFGTAVTNPVLVGNRFVSITTKLVGTIPATLYASGNEGLPDRGPLKVMSADRGDGSLAIVAGVDEETQVFATPLAAPRTVTLSTTGVWKGARFHILRQASATGASALNVGTGPLKAMPLGSFCIVEYDGAAWTLIAYSLL